MSFPNTSVIDVQFSSDCNMKCQYCYLHKNKKGMVAYNRLVQQKLADGSFAANIIRVAKDFKDNIHSLGLWGAEPTLNADYFEVFMSDLLDNFENMSTITFSTNGSLGSTALFKFYQDVRGYAESHKRPLHLDIQISIDGPEWINDCSRQANATKGSIDAVNGLIDLVEPNNNYFLLSICTKPTLDTSYMKMMNDDPKLHVEYFKFMDDLHSNWMEHNKLSGSKVQLNTSQRPTLVTPGTHTVEAGKIFAEYIRNVKSIDDEQFTYFKHPLFVQFDRNFFDAIESKGTLLTSNSSLGCSGGNGAISISPFGKVTTCHRLFEALYNDEQENVGDILSNESFDVGDEFGSHRLPYTMTAFHEYVSSRRMFAEIMMLSLVSSGQIGEIFLDQQQRNKLFLMSTGMTCHTGHSVETRNTYCLPTSYFKLLGNGAMEELQDYMFKSRSSTFNHLRSKLKLVCEEVGECDDI